MKLSAENIFTRKNKLKKQNKYYYGLFILLIVIFVALIIVKPKFLSTGNYMAMVNQFPEFGLMALGVMLAMITGGIDLSPVGIANLTSVCCAMLLKNMLLPGDNGSVVGAFFAVILIAFLVGAGCGVFNGFLVSKVKIPPILATLGSYELFTGICVIVTNGKAVSGLPIAYTDIMSYNFFGIIPVSLVIFVVAVISVSFLITKTTYGSKLYMLGTNPKAARFSGLEINKIVIKTYLISGLLAAVAGMVMLSNYNSAKADYGSSYMLQTILICVLGGVNPNGGYGKVAGVTLAILVLQFLASGLNMFSEISNFYQPLIWGSVLLIVMIINYYTVNSRSKLSKK